MGMPITSYKVLRLLADPAAARGPDDQKLRGALAEFSLHAVILHDPARHAALHDVLRSRFERLDRVTGRRLLFFAAVETDPQWRAYAAQRHYFSAVEELLHIDYARAVPSRSIDPELSVVSSALALGIPAGDLPCIVVFRGGEREFCWFRTGAAGIERQLERLALAAHSLDPHGAADFGGLARYLGDFEIDRPWSSLDAGQSVAGQLAGVLAASASEYFEHDDARRQLERTVAEQQGALRRVLAAQPEADEARLRDIVQRALRLGMTLALQQGGTAESAWPWLRRELWEIEAAAALAAAMKLTAMEDPDVVAPIVMCYGRSFEAEINASVVQGLRQRLGVRMPQFYTQHQPGVAATIGIEANGRSETIDFNIKRDRRWLPPGLGQSEEAARKLGAGEPFGPRAWETLMQEWAIIRRHRNLAAHPGPTNPESVKACHKAFLRLQSRRVFHAAFALKTQLRG